MLKRYVVVGGVLLFSFAILLISIFRSAAVKYTFSAINANSKDQLIIAQSEAIGGVYIDYYLAYPGPVLPDSFWWPLKALRDKLWLVLTTNSTKKAELNLLFADKRLLAAKILFEKGKYEEGFTTLSKAEKYLESACELEEMIRGRGGDTLNLATTLIKASLKHRQVIKQILLIAPGDAIPKITLIEHYPRGVYGQKVHVLQDRGVVAIPDPFNGL